jgi:hypothetical protein
MSTMFATGCGYKYWLAPESLISSTLASQQPHILH